MDYRCYFLGNDGHIRDYVKISALTDSEAIAHAQKRLVETIHDGFDLWQLARFVHGVATR